MSVRSMGQDDFVDIKRVLISLEVTVAPDVEKVSNMSGQDAGASHTFWCNALCIMLFL